MTRPGFVTPRPDWLTVPAVVIASGPSLSDEQLEHVEHVREVGACRVITVNNTCERAPWADAHYFGDYMAVKHYAKKLKPPNGPCMGEWWSGSTAARDSLRTHYVKTAPHPGFGDKVVHLNGNSGAQAINLAMLWGSRRILLLGFDMKPAKDGRAHWFGQHPPHLVTVQLFQAWRDALAKAAPDADKRGVAIVNVTPGSALECFRRGDLFEELQA